MGGQLRGVAFAVKNAAHDLKPGHAGDITEHDVKQKIHLGQRLLHALDMGGSLLHQFSRWRV